MNAIFIDFLRDEMVRSWGHRGPRLGSGIALPDGSLLSGARLLLRCHTAQNVQVRTVQQRPVHQVREVTTTLNLKKK